VAEEAISTDFDDGRGNLMRSLDDVAAADAAARAWTEEQVATVAGR
jgi:hypothetical protein